MSDKKLPCCYLSPLLLLLFPQTLKTVHFCSSVTSVSSPLDEINLDFLCIFLEIFMFSKLTLLPLVCVCSILTSLCLEVSTAGPGLPGELFCKPHITNTLLSTPAQGLGVPLLQHHHVVDMFSLGSAMKLSYKMAL